MRGVLLERRVRTELGRSDRGCNSGAAADVAAGALPAAGTGVIAGIDERRRGHPRGWEAIPRNGPRHSPSAGSSWPTRPGPGSRRWASIEARRPCERAAQHARDEISEMIAFLEDMPLRRAVKRLELARRRPRAARLILRGLAVTPRSKPAPDGQAPAESIDRSDESVSGRRRRKPGARTDRPPGPRARAAAAKGAR